jgi:hypothetical protein
MIFCKRCQPIHARHLDVEGDDVRQLLADALGGYKRIAGGGNHHYFRIRGENLVQCLTDHGGVIHDKNANFRFAHCQPFIAGWVFRCTVALEALEILIKVVTFLFARETHAGPGSDS